MKRRTYQLEDYFQHIQDLIRNRKIRQLCYVLFGDHVTEGQCEIIESIVYRDHKRVVINCFTRYGKSFCVSRAIAILILCNKDFDIQVIAPTNEQSRIIMDYVQDCIYNCDLIANLLPFDYDTDAERLKKEATKRRIRFKNGVDLRIFSAEGKGERLMGFGSRGILIDDEDALIGFEVWQSKISRMLGDSPDTAFFALGNPWHRNNQFYMHFIDPKYHKIHIGWEQGLKEGRITQEFVDEQRENMSPMHFEVLYDSNFPEESQFQLIPNRHIDRALNKVLKTNKGHNILSSDIASMGMDFTVHTFIRVINRIFFVYKITHQSKKNPEQVSGTINFYYKEEDLKRNYVDAVGLGEGVYANLLADGKDCIPIKAGTKPTEYSRDSGIQNKFNFSNSKAELYWNLKEMFERNEIFFSADIDKSELNKLIQELSKIEWEIDRSSKIRIIDHKKEEKSPDYCFKGDTKILTTKGYKQIKDISKNDKVITPFGIRKVLATSVRKTHDIMNMKFSNGSTLECTHNHKIFTNNKFIKASTITYANELDGDTLWNLLKWRLKNIVCIKDSNIGFREQADTFTGIFAKKVNGQKKHCIVEYGKILTIKRFLKGLSSIILMEMPLITILKIYNFLVTISINLKHLKKDLRIQSISRKIVNSLMKLEKNQKHGIVQTKVETGINNIISIVLKLLKNNIISAFFVKRNSYQQEIKKSDFVQMDVHQNTIIVQKNIKKKETVLSVIKNFLHLNIRKPRLVQNHVHPNLPVGIDVYNITVEHDNVYYANHILVSNSDSCAYSMMEYIRNIAGINNMTITHTEEDEAHEQTEEQLLTELDDDII